ncbi:MAG: hypothetical protein AAF799_29550 [Myxococcota bacterium]
MSTRRRFRRKPDTAITAVPLELDTQGFTYQKWGGAQHCKQGDWIVRAGHEVYTVDRETFARTYRELSPGRYEKVGFVWAEQANTAGSITTKEGLTAYQAGDYLVFNDKEGVDGYAMPAEKFHRLYQPVLTDMSGSK